MEKGDFIVQHTITPNLFQCGDKEQYTYIPSGGSSLPWGGPQSASHRAASGSQPVKGEEGVGKDAC